MMLAGAQIVDESSVAYTSGKSGNTETSAAMPPEQGSSREAQSVDWNPASAQGLHMVPKVDPVDIHFSNITCTVKLGINKGSKQILHGVNGRLRPRQLIAIMGPSGAGKSTLLDVLSGYRITGVGGAVFINGRGRIMKRFKRMSCYIQQDDRLQGLLTVGENMALAADLKLPTKLDKYEKGEVIEDILTNLGLYEHMNTRGAQLSGGQRKRLSIALELINNPLIIGLDSSSCTQVVQLCQTLAHQGRTIICTVHQPSASLFALFDQVYVLAAGRCMYQGTTKNLVPYLQQAGIPCPKYHNPADYIIELSCGEYGQDKIDLMANKSENGKALDWFDDHQSIPSMEGLRKLVPLSVLRDTEPTGGDEETIPNEMSILSKEHFNRWYSLGSYYISITIVDLPISIVGCAVFSVIVYTMSSQPLEIARFSMFFAISLYTVLVAQSFGLMIGAVFSVVEHS
ncbi:unnamed protein product [Spodoptera littoralis]|uniref:ABC transporter domain-containing protein n=1 Tax=Spodoptera littoralis TaxID=7109 RepID=A0A9P0IH57_SPOLI|nr:unnamed protein product [Spodoptera littoralis]